MIPSILSRQLHQGIRDFIGATFPMASPYFTGMVDRFLDKPGNVFKGPYYQLGLPYARSGRMGLPFENIKIDTFNPYIHQSLAWDRLSGDSGESTIIATGTGSGKTECFLYPILDYCARHRGPGIKAILLYPMNALADDQARRIARLIDAQAGLAGLRAGVYTGAAGEIKTKTMSADGLITDRDTLREFPPDILLTNYKMLDLLLLRSRDRGLWQAKALRYLVVDELHSFDGAQGTDLACLIRRLRERLDRGDRGSLACVGTSATLGGKEDAKPLLDFASSVFLSDFPDEALIRERRQRESDFLEGSFVTRISLPGPQRLEELRPFGGDEDPRYLERQKLLWFPDEAWDGSEEDRVLLGESLKTHGVFQNLLRYMEGRPRKLDDLCRHIRKTYAPARDWDEEQLALTVDSLFALISHARTRSGAELIPFLTVRTQFWMRELRRLVSDVALQGAEAASEPTLRLADEIPPTDRRMYLPLVHCRECNTAGWLTREAPGEAPVIQDLRQIYNGYFNESKDTIILYPAEPGSEIPGVTTAWLLCPVCGFLSRIGETACGHCHHVGLLPVNKATLLNEAGKFVNQCPRCSSAGDLTIMGSKAASLLAALVGQTFSSPFNSDKKLLAFSDSVQDAAHRAGFLTSRAWTFSFRTAICKALAEAESPVSLGELTRGFMAYWRGRTGTAEDFVGTFLPPDLEWLEEYQVLVSEARLPPGTGLPELLERRLGWELASELTFRSRIGRTLERTGTAIAAPAGSALEDAARYLAEEASERQERFRATAHDHPGWRRFLWGMVFRLKNLGAVNDPSLRPFFSSANSFTFARANIHMPALFPRYPHILTTEARKTTQEALIAKEKRRSWFESWWDMNRHDLAAGLLLDENLLDAEILHLAVTALCRAGILVEEELPLGQGGWLLNRDALFVTDAVSSLRCSACGSALQVAEPEKGITEGMRCLRFGCRGSYARDEKKAADYYRNLYMRGEVVRINGREHTGLLSGIVRKNLEDSFLTGLHPWDPNLLSATPTLEMGINIGDLSTVFLCSIPPGVANYLQRIGRAGRTDGNAYVMTMANAFPHDQYFFQSPEEMLDGLVEPPAIYLNAGAVLERHLTAFALSRWMLSLPAGKDPVPRTLGDVLAARKNDNTALFPLALYAAIGREWQKWLDSFFTVFSHLDPDGEEKALLANWLTPDEQGQSMLEKRLDERLSLVAENIERMRNRRAVLQKKVAELGKQGALTEDQQRESDEMQNEASSLSSSVNELRKKDTWQFLCDEGILPNYAFPETGVKLDATFYRKRRNPAAGEKFQYEHLELVRSASSALRELAPENEFYGCGHRMKINRVDLQASKLETWRFCPACSHAVPDTHEDFKLSDCPACRSADWADTGQVRSLLRFRQVYSFSSYKESLISDNEEDREPLHYNTKLLVDFRPDDPENRYFGLEDNEAPMALEFIKHASFREVNFGKLDSSQNGFPVAGDVQAKTGFPVCLQCGTLDGTHHAPDCPNNRRTESRTGSADVIHLYHEFMSEAIRILVPVPDFGLDAGTALQSLIAAVYLGLRKFFGGKVDHLRIIEEQSETSGGAVLQYLVLYDSIPGGSGYLKNFFLDAKDDRTNAFFQVLQKALDTLDSCACRQDPEKDGCYHCVLSHKVSYRMKDVSRKKAIAVLQRILTYREALVRVQQPASARIDPLFDSRLEELFVGALKSPHLWPVSVSVSPEFYHGKTGNHVRIGSQEYHLEQQVQINVRTPVQASTSADFVFYPLTSGELPVIVFTDGYSYHKNSIANDLRIRLALVSSGKYRVFSFSWEDVTAVLEKRMTELDALGHPWINAKITNEQAKTLQALRLDRQSWPGADQLMGLKPLIAMLSLPEADRDALWIDKARHSFMSNLVSTPPEPDGVEALSIRTGLRLKSGGLYSRRMLSPDGMHELTMVLEPPESGMVPDLSGWMVFDDTRESEQVDWNALLDLVNLYQVLPRFYFACASLSTEEDWMTAYVIQAAPVSDTWFELRDLVLADWLPFLEHLKSLGAPLPEIGYEFMDDEGRVLFSAELAWPERRVAVLAGSTEPIAQVEGWTFLSWSPETPFPEINFGGSE